MANQPPGEWLDVKFIIHTGKSIAERHYFT